MRGKNNVGKNERETKGYQYRLSREEYIKIDYISLKVKFIHAQLMDWKIGR